MSDGGVEGMWAVPQLCIMYPGNCLTTEEKSWKTSERAFKMCSGDQCRARLVEWSSLVSFLFVPIDVRRQMSRVSWLTPR